ncbi:MAG: type II toxin-antitoxin system RelE/ParE family toxin [Sphingomonas bacterium]
MKPVVFSPAASADLKAIGLYIADDNPDRAVSFVAELEMRAHKIGERPLAFSARNDISPGLRGVAHGRYLILFRNLAEEVRIVRILHSARDAGVLARQGGFQS